MNVYSIHYRMLLSAPIVPFAPHTQSAKLDEAKKLIDEGGDWDRRNRLKLYRALHCMFVRDFKTAASLLLDCVATFTVRLSTVFSFLCTSRAGFYLAAGSYACKSVRPFVFSAITKSITIVVCVHQLYSCRLLLLHLPLCLSIHFVYRPYMSLSCPLPSHQATELFPYSQFVLYTIVASMVAESRTVIGAKIVKSPEVCGVVMTVPLGSLASIAHTHGYLAFMIIPLLEHWQHWRSPGII
jgi:hypothetical protein